MIGILIDFGQYINPFKLTAETPDDS
jgi:hypothetical protein